MRRRVDGAALLLGLLGLLGLGLLGLVVTGCTGAGDRGPSDAAGRTGSPTGTPRGTGPPPTDPLTERCLSLTPRGADVERRTLHAPGLTLPGALTRPQGPAVAGVVFLHQVGPAGYCGWLKYAAVLADDGIASLAIDQCGYGESECSESMATRADLQVRAAVQALHREWPGLPVTLVGASMGGSRTVRAVAAGAPVGAWVDVSGPSAWDGDRLLDLAGRVRLPGLVVQARSDGPSEFRKARALADATGARFLEAPGGHGWDLVLTLRGRPTPVGRTIADFVLAHTEP